MPNLYVTDDELRSVLSMGDAVAAVRQAMVALANKEFDMPARTVLGDGQFLIMPTQHRPTGTAVVKTLSINFDRVPAISGTLVWSELGRVDHLVVDAGAATAVRTGAIVGVATDLLASKTASRLAMIGAGAQAADQVRAVHAVRPLRELIVADHDRARADGLCQRLTAELPGVAVSVEIDVEKAVQDVDVVCCATPATEPLFRAEALPESVHVNAIGSFRPTMRELPPELLTSATVLVDEVEAVLSEAGEVIDVVARGLLPQESLIELGTALQSADRDWAARTVFKTVGVAAQDWAIGRSLAASMLP